LYVHSRFAQVSDILGVGIIFQMGIGIVDEAGNSTTQQVNVIVDNAPPSVSITQSWWIWETAEASVYEQIIPLGSISITVECGNLPV